MSPILPFISVTGGNNSYYLRIALKVISFLATRPGKDTTIFNVKPNNKQV